MSQGVLWMYVSLRGPGGWHGTQGRAGRHSEDFIRFRADGGGHCPFRSAPVAVTDGLGTLSTCSREPPGRLSTTGHSECSRRSREVAMDFNEIQVSRLVSGPWRERQDLSNLFRNGGQVHRSVKRWSRVSDLDNDTFDFASSRTDWEAFRTCSRELLGLRIPRTDFWVLPSGTVWSRWCCNRFGWPPGPCWER